MPHYTLIQLWEFAGWTALAFAALGTAATMTAWETARHRPVLAARLPLPPLRPFPSRRRRDDDDDDGEPTMMWATGDVTCPFRCACTAGPYHCANLHLPPSQLDHDPAACPDAPLAASLARHPASGTGPLLRPDVPWIDDQLGRLHEWADRIASGSSR
jgi:hypothetical protein